MCNKGVPTKQGNIAKLVRGAYIPVLRFFVPEKYSLVFAILSRLIGTGIFLITFLLTSCGDVAVYAPVSEALIEPAPKSGGYRVHADDTLYSIAWRYGLDYRYLAKINRINPPYYIQTGQLIYIHPITVRSTSKRCPLLERAEHEPVYTVRGWQWPARGAILQGFSGFNKGINVGGNVGDPVRAAAAGKVVYSGNGLRAYGNLIIIKHNPQFLSAYAYNYTNLVKEGDRVSPGQKIAEMGRNAQVAVVHFEIRRYGKPVNPLNYLAAR